VHGAVRVTFPTSAVDARIRRYWLVLGLIAACVLAGATAVGLSIARFVIRPLRRVEAAAAAVGAGDLDARAPETEGPEEVRSLARVLNESVAKLSLLLSSQQEFVADASHELRTPLTALRLRLETGDTAGALAEAERLSELVDGLLALARADAGAEPAASVDLAELAHSRAAHWLPLAEERGLTLTVEGENGTVRAGRARLVQVIDNLVANALDAARSSVVVAVTARELRVEDDGPGLTAEQQARAFDRFWSDRDGGSGLGLAIVKRLVEIDGGRVALRDAPGGGLTAVVELRSS
jgi:signal transduction histidine kinase